MIDQDTLNTLAQIAATAGLSIAGVRASITAIREEVDALRRRIVAMEERIERAFHVEQTKPPGT